jgi:hypothetical protein
MAFSFSVKLMVKTKSALPPIPIQVAAILANVAVLAAQFPALMPRRRIVSIVKIAPQLSAIMRDFSLVAPDVAPVTPPIVSEHGSRTKSQKQ